MPCICEKCGCICNCGEKLCTDCFIDYELEDDTERNLFTGGRFYGENLLKEDNVVKTTTDG